MASETITEIGLNFVDHVAIAVPLAHWISTSRFTKKWDSPSFIKRKSMGRTKCEKRSLEWETATT